MSYFHEKCVMRNPKGFVLYQDAAGLYHLGKKEVQIFNSYEKMTIHAQFSLANLGIKIHFYSLCYVHILLGQEKVGKMVQYPAYGNTLCSLHMYIIPYKYQEYALLKGGHLVNH